ncbi:MAG: SDR family oxidoreductase [Burkholderiaceae bacterium]|jgi:nucleoside-diphosphate-sugar epimerase|nr:SDR family oxidoreductase [Burkholderiaceae bacterium]
MNVIVTGHKGFIGTVMVPMLQAAGHKVRGIDSDLYRNSTYGPAPAPVEEIIKDVRDLEKSDLEGADAVVHLAALSNDVLGDLNPDITYEINHKASVRIAEMARDAGVPRFVFASSCSMYGAAGDAVLDETAEFNPVTAYAISKVLVERDVRELANDRFSPVFMRNATAYGVSPRIRFDLVINNLVAWAYTTGLVRMISDGTPWRPLVHIEDISRAVVAALAAPREAIHNQAFNVGSSAETYQIKTLAEMVMRAVPESRIEFAGGAGPDKRNYKVNFDKYAAAFPAHLPTWSAERGVRAIYDTYRRVGLNKDDYEGPQYKRIAQLKHLLATGQLDDSYRWRA